MKFILKSFVTVSLFVLISIWNNAFGQAFTGKIVYHVQMVDTAVQNIIDDRELIVYTNDTLSRIVAQNDALGEQVTIKHLSLKKSYLLMEIMGTKLAIQTNATDDTSKVEPYFFKYKFFGRKKMNGFVMKKATVYREDLVEKRTIWYLKKVRPDLTDMYKGIRGLPSEFYIGTVDGIVHYTLKSIENTAVERDLFGIPSDYEKITLEEFMKFVRKKN